MTTEEQAAREELETIEEALALRAERVKETDALLEHIERLVIRARARVAELVMARRRAGAASTEGEGGST